MPVVPLFSLPALQDTLVALQRNLFKTRSARSAPLTNSFDSLLPYCSTNPPIPEHSRNVLSDLCHSLAELAQAATTQDGRQGLRQLSDASSPPEVIDSILGFWEEEFLVE